MIDDAFPGNWVRVMADVYASGVWNREGIQCSLESLPIPQRLRDRIEAWQEHYNKLELREFDGEIIDWTHFADEGLAAAREVKASLPDWTVIYFDESKPRFNQPSETYDYEILADRPETEK